MAVFRIEKTRDYMVIENFHLRDTELSLKAMRLLALMLSLGRLGLYHKGLGRICREGVDSLCSIIRELEDHGYILRERVRNEKAQLTTLE